MIEDRDNHAGAKDCIVETEDLVCRKGKAVLLQLSPECSLFDCRPMVLGNDWSGHC
jgi:hypothetical protein